MTRVRNTQAPSSSSGQTVQADALVPPRRVKRKNSDGPIIPVVRAKTRAAFTRAVSASEMKKEREKSELAKIIESVPSLITMSNKLMIKIIGVGANDFAMVNAAHRYFVATLRKYEGSRERYQQAFVMENLRERINAQIQAMEDNDDKKKREYFQKITSLKSELDALHQEILESQRQEHNVDGEKFTKNVVGEMEVRADLEQAQIAVKKRSCWAALFCCVSAEVKGDIAKIKQEEAQLKKAYESDPDEEYERRIAEDAKKRKALEEQLQKTEVAMPDDLNPMVEKLQTKLAEVDAVITKNADNYYSQLDFESMYACIRFYAALSKLAGVFKHMKNIPEEKAALKDESQRNAASDLDAYINFKNGKFSRKLKEFYCNDEELSRFEVYYEKFTGLSADEKEKVLANPLPANPLADVVFKELFKKLFPFPMIEAPAPKNAPARATTEPSSSQPPARKIGK